MILYKTIALQFGRFLETGRPGNEFDLVGRKFPTDETRINRRAFLSDLANARLYLLDHRAANYLDSLRMDVQGMPWETRDDSEIQAYVREVDFPRELVWVEYDARQLWLDRVTRGLTTMSGLDLRHLSQRGFLFDNRSEDVMTVQLFNGMTDRSFLEPLATLVLRKSRGRPDFTDAAWQPQTIVLMAHARGDTEEHIRDVQALLEEHKAHVSYEMVIGLHADRGLGGARGRYLVRRNTQSHFRADEDSSEVREDLDDGDAPVPCYNTHRTIWRTAPRRARGTASF
jgi:hypothetical protein